jgi:hypothetical protein
MNNKLITTPNELAAEQCGRVSEAGTHQSCKWSWLRKETTSKPRTAAASGALAVILKTRRHNE